MQVWYLGESNRRFGWSIFQVAISLLKDYPCVLNCTPCQGHFELVYSYFLDTYTKIISLISDISLFGYPHKWTHDI